MAFIQHRQALYFLSFFSVKTLLFPFGLQLGTGLQGVKKLLSGCGEQMPWHLRDTEASSPAWGWAFTRDTSPAQPAVVSQVLAIFLMSFTSWSRKWLSRKSQRWRSVRAESGACWSKRACFSSSPGLWKLPCIQGFSPLILGGHLHVLEEGAASALVWIFKKHRAPSCFPWATWQKSWPMPSRATSLQQKIEAQREVDVESLQI